MAARLNYKIDDARALGAMRALMDQADDPTDIMRGIATIGESSTRERFATETGPDGEQWAPSLRQQIEGGQTLTKDGHLGDSITSDYSRERAAWGTNRIYGGIHQKGGVIRAKSARALEFTLANGAVVVVQSVRIPARPYLGISDDDAADIGDFIAEKIWGRLVR